MAIYGRSSDLLEHASIFQFALTFALLSVPYGVLTLVSIGVPLSKLANWVFCLVAAVVCAFSIAAFWPAQTGNDMGGLGQTFALLFEYAFVFGLVTVTLVAEGVRFVWKKWRQRVRSSTVSLGGR